MNSIADIIGQYPQVSALNNEPAISGLGAFQSPAPATTAERNDAEPATQKSQKHLDQAKAMIHGMKDQLDALLRLIQGEEAIIHAAISTDSVLLDTGERIIEGVFNGEKMVGSDGNEYAVPPNYASKSKLVEGDMMKLTITKSGSFVYKQIGPIARKRLVGELMTGDRPDQWKVFCDEKLYKILTASVTFYRGKPGDEVIFLVPEGGESDWGAVENIIHK